MNWTQQIPESDGLYWMFKAGWDVPSVVEVYYSQPGRRWDGTATEGWWGVRLLGTDEDYFNREIPGAWWMGPIDVPSLPPAALSDSQQVKEESNADGK